MMVRWNHTTWSINRRQVEEDRAATALRRYKLCRDELNVYQPRLADVAIQRPQFNPSSICCPSPVFHEFLVEAVFSSQKIFQQVLQ